MWLSLCPRPPRSNGTLVTADVRGTVTCNSRMSGVPDLTLIFNTPAVIEDCSFHPCVRYARWERENVVSFVPPDGVFTLMTYRVADRVPSLPIACRPSVTMRDGGGRATFTLMSRPMTAKAAGGAGASLISTADIGVEDVRLTVSFPRSIKSVDMASDTGSVTLDPRSNDVVWSMRSLPKDKSPELGGLLHLAPGAPVPIETPSATLHFSVGGQTASGLAVKDLLLVSEKYAFFKGARYQLRAGRVQIRT